MESRNPSEEDHDNHEQITSSSESDFGSDVDQVTPNLFKCKMCPPDFLFTVEGLVAHRNFHRRQNSTGTGRGSRSRISAKWLPVSGQSNVNVTPAAPGTSKYALEACDSSDTNSLVTYLECKICLDACASPIYNCPNGHLLCGLCHDKLKADGVPKCPLKCTGPLSPCALGERLSREHDLMLECQFKESGCSTPILAALLKDHVETCDNRDINCNTSIENGVCKELIPMLKYSEHVIHVHKKLICENKTIGVFLIEPFIEGNLQSRSYWKDLQAYDTVMIKFDGHAFLLHVVTKQDSVHWWFTILHNTTTAEKYKVETRLLQPSNGNVCNLDTLIDLPVLPFHGNQTFNELSCSYATISAARLDKFYVEKSQDHSEKNLFKISWKIARVPPSQSQVERLKDRKRKAEDELAEINRKLVALETPDPAVGNI